MKFVTPAVAIALSARTGALAQGSPTLRMLLDQGWNIVAQSIVNDLDGKRGRFILMTLQKDKQIAFCAGKVGISLDVGHNMPKSTTYQCWQ